MVNLQAFIHLLVAATEITGSIIIAIFCMRAAIRLIRKHEISQAQRLIADGAILGLTWKTAAALGRTMVIASWQSIGSFAAILALRIVLKKIFTWELNVALQKQSPHEEAPNSRVA